MNTYISLIFISEDELVLAGIDTVSVTTLWTYLLLCNYKDVQQKLINEIDGFIKSNKRLPTFEDRLELPYYNAVQKECIRFRPIGYFAVPHKTTKDGKRQ
jgi:cytochrome P450